MGDFLNGSDFQYDCEGNGAETLMLASAPGEARLVVIILRGAMDGLGAVQPYGDPLLATYRPGFSIGPANGHADLDGFFALHSGMASLMPMWTAGELAFAHATSTPYRSKRSHFDGQDILECGAGEEKARDGWLNRVVQLIPGATMELTYATGFQRPLVATGSAPFSVWQPGYRVGLYPADISLMEFIYAPVPLYATTWAETIATNQALPAISQAETSASFIAGRMKESTRLAVFSIPGWDTHANQAPQLNTRLTELADAINRLKTDLGAAAWANTAVIAMTEFGRTARQNGSGGTDHGTGGTAIIAGGLVNGGRVYGDWPGLTDLYQNRDLMPTGDVRRYPAWMLKSMFGLTDTQLETFIFPGLEMGGCPGVTP